jgi:hypothetical protein
MKPITTSKFRSDLKVLADFEPFLKDKKLINEPEPKINSDFSIGSYNYNEGSTSPIQLLRNILKVIGNDRVRKINPNIIFTGIEVRYQKSIAMKDPAIDLNVFEKNLVDIVDFLKENPNKVNNYTKYITGFNTMWQDPDKMSRYNRGVAQSIAKQEKENPNWSKD